MSQRVFIQDLSSGMTVDQVFVVREKDLRTTKKGDYYITATLGDRTGGISGRMWQASEAVFNGIPAEGFLHVKGRVEEYRGTLQLVIDACRPVPNDKVDLGDFVPVSPYDVEEMWSELTGILLEVKDRHLKALLKAFLGDAALVSAVKRSPAAVQMHHPYSGGLIEHTLNVMRAAKAILPLYPQLNADLVLTSIFLHDLAKSGELTGGLANSYTERGQLVGHITMACVWVQEKARQVAEEYDEPFPPRLINLLQHVILAHHGEHQFGSPKLPAVPEAFFLHYLDNLDAKMWMTLNAIGSDPDHQSNFTPYLRQLETRLYKLSNHPHGPNAATDIDKEDLPRIFEDVQ